MRYMVVATKVFDNKHQHVIKVPAWNHEDGKEIIAGLEMAGYEAHMCTNTRVGDKYINIRLDDLEFAARQLQDAWHEHVRNTKPRLVNTGE